MTHDDGLVGAVARDGLGGARDDGLEGAVARDGLGGAPRPTRQLICPPGKGAAAGSWECSGDALPRPFSRAARRYRPSRCVPDNNNAGRLCDLIV